MKKWNVYMVGGLLGLAIAHSHASVTGLEFVQPFNAQINSSIMKQRKESQTVIKSALAGRPFKIPTQWRLVSVVPSDKKDELVYVFQTTAGDVYSLSMDMMGAINPNALLHIPVQ